MKDERTAGMFAANPKCANCVSGVFMDGTLETACVNPNAYLDLTYRTSWLDGSLPCPYFRLDHDRAEKKREAAKKVR